MKVLHLISSGGLYGAEKMILNLLPQLAKSGVQPALAIFRNERNPHVELATAFRAAGIETKVIPCAGRMDFAAGAAVRDFLRVWRADLLHTHGYKADLYGYIATRGAGRPLVATCHNWTNSTSAIRLYSILDRHILRRFDGVAAVSRDVAAELEAAGVERDRIRFIANGVAILEQPAEPIASYCGVPVTGRTVIGLIGRLVPEKRFHDVLNVSPRIVAAHPDVLFVIVGAGPDRQHLECITDELGLRSHVVFAGQRSDMDAVFDSLDIFVLPSSREGMPLTVLEAMAAGVPVIATRTGAIPDLLARGEGILIGAGDMVGLTKALDTLLSDRRKRREMGVLGRLAVQSHYSAEMMANGYVSMYGDVLRGRALAPEPAASGHLKVISAPARPVKASVIIPALNAAPVLRRCLSALAAMDLSCDRFEVIVVDNGSTDGTAAAAQSFGDALNIRVLERPGVTISAARNWGAQYARGDYLVFLDADCLPPANWLTGILTRFSEARAGVIGGRYAIPHGSSWVARTWHRHRQEKVGRVSYVPGGNLSIRRDIFKRIGGFDPTLETNEDYDLCQRAAECGHCIEAYADLSVCHLGEAQSIQAFLEKQRWHGTDVFRVFLLSFPKLRNVKAVAFTVYFAVCLAGAAAGVLLALFSHYELLALSVISSVSGPLLIATLACVRRRTFGDILPLSALFFIFGLARAACLLCGGRGRRRRRAVTESANHTSANLESLS